MKIRFSLMEAVRYATLLTESQRRDFVLKNHGAQLEKKFLSSHIPADVRTQIDPEHVMDGGDGEFKEGELAGRIIDFISGHDPSIKKIYTLWMTQRHLKGEMPLEDMPGVERYLAFFDSNKLRFAKRDIGQYRTVDELATAVNGFSEKSAPVEKLRNDADMRVIYDSANLSIVQPKTAAGATELAGDAIWCTAWDAGRNRFYYYDGKGPIYVIIDKKRKARWQFFMPTNGYPSAEFMDRANRAIDLRAFLTEYPMVFEVIGEEAFVPYMKQIGLSFFSADAIRKVDNAELAEMIVSVDDLAKFPQDVVNSKDFAQSLLMRLTPPSNTYANEETVKQVRKILTYYLTKFPDEFFSNLFEARPALFSYLPSRFHTDENKIKAATTLNFSSIEKMIPKPWPKEVESEFWRKSIIQNDRLKINDVPEKYLNDEQRVTLLRRTPAEITKYPRLNEAMVVRFLTLDHNLIDHIPEKFRKEAAANAMSLTLDSKDNHTRASGIQKYGRFFPMSLWPVDFAELLIKSSKAQEASYNELPREYRTVETLKGWVKAEPKNYIKLPAEMRTVEMLAFMLTCYTNEKAIALLTPELCSPHTFAMALEKSKDEYYHTADQYKALPQYLKTEEVVRLFLTKGVVPVKEMGKLISSDALVARVRVNIDETKDIPAGIMSPALASALVTANPLVIPFVPEKMRTEEVLYHWLGSIKNGQAARYTSTYNTTQKPTIKDDFALFPKSSWSQRTLPLAVELRALPADLATLPKELLSRELVGAIAGENEDVFSHEDAHIIDEENIVKAIRKNWKVYTKLKPDQIVEPTIHAFLAATASSFGNAIKQSKEFYVQDYVKQHLADFAPIYEAMPKAKWSARCWMEVVGLIYPLGKVPARFRTQDMIVTALRRDASQAKYLDNPTQWMDENAKALLKDKVDDKTWKSELLKGGIFKTGRNYVDVVDLPHKPLSNGYSYIIVDLGKVNKRIFIFDKKKNVIVRLYTEDYTIKSENHNEMTSHAKIVHEFALTANDELQNISPGVLNYVGIQSNVAGDYIPEEKMRRDHENGDVLKWAVGSYGGGKIRLAFKGDKVIFNMIETMSGGAFGNKASLKMSECTPKVKLTAIHPHAAEIAKYLNRNRVDGWRGTSIGIGNGSRHSEKWQAITKTKIAEVGALAVWRGEGIYEKTISIYHETKGRLGSAVIRKKGNLDKIEVRGDSGFAKEINELFDSLQGKVPYHAVK